MNDNMSLEQALEYALHELDDEKERCEHYKDLEKKKAREEYYRGLKNMVDIITSRVYHGLVFVEYVDGHHRLTNIGKE